MRVLRFPAWKLFAGEDEGEAEGGDVRQAVGAKRRLHVAEERAAAIIVVAGCRGDLRLPQLVQPAQDALMLAATQHAAERQHGRQVARATRATKKKPQKTTHASPIRFFPIFFFVISM